jgi:hypothetical protein
VSFAVLVIPNATHFHAHRRGSYFFEGSDDYCSGADHAGGGRELAPEAQST